MKGLRMFFCLAGAAYCWHMPAPRPTVISDSEARGVGGGAPSLKCYRDNPYTCPNQDPCPDIKPAEGCPNGFYVPGISLPDVQEAYLGPNRYKKEKVYDPNDLGAMLIGKTLYCYEKWSCKTKAVILVDACVQDAFIQNWDGHACRAVDFNSDECP